jgi:hypothetical protein
VYKVNITALGLGFIAALKLKSSKTFDAKNHICVKGLYMLINRGNVIITAIKDKYNNNNHAEGI